MADVVCRTLHGDTRRVPVDKLIIRPAVYAIIVHDWQVLLLKSRETGKWMQPGGGIQQGETVEAALHREVYEEVGIQVKIEVFAHFEQDFFYYDPLDIAFQGYLFFYYCTPKSLDLNPPNVNTEEGTPKWVKISELAPDDFESHGELIMKLVHARQDV